MSSERIPRARLGRWFTRDSDDPIDGEFDRSPAPQATVNATQLIDPPPPPPAP